MSNTFNSSSWQHVIRSLSQLKMSTNIQLIIKDYFVNRKLLYDIDVHPVEYLVTGGVPQKSVMVPLLRTAVYDFSSILARQTALIGYSANITVVIVNKYLEDVVK